MTQALSQKLTLSCITLDLDRWVLTVEDQEIHVTRNEFLLLADLIENTGRVRTREKLIDCLYPSWSSEHSLDNHIYRLRQKLARCTSVRIASMRGVGFVMRLDNTQPSHVRINYDANLIFMSAETPASTVLGYQSTDLVGTDPTLLLAMRMLTRDEMRQWFTTRLGHGQRSFSGPVAIRHADNTTHLHQVVFTSRTDERQQFAGVALELTSM